MKLNKLQAIILAGATLLGASTASAHTIGKACTTKFNMEQLELIQASYDAGKKHDYGWTLAAMAWQESSAGVKPLNWNDPSFGPFHANIKSVSNRFGAKNQHEEFFLAQELMYNFNFAVEAAVAELDYWKKIRKGNWRKMVMSYNAGGNMSAGQAHLNKIITKIQFLKSNNCVDTSMKEYDYVEKGLSVPDSLDRVIE